MSRIRVQTEGISRDFNSVATEAKLTDRGVAEEAEVIHLLRRMRSLCAANGDESDRCSPRALVHGPGGDFVFIGRHDGTLYCPETGTAVEPEEGAAWVAGSACPAGRTESPACPRGMAPARRAHLPASDRHSLSADGFPVGTTFQHCVSIVSKRPEWVLALVSGCLLAGTALALLIAGFRTSDLRIFASAVAAGGAGVAILALWGKRAREPLRIGIDWKSNTLWVLRGDSFRAAPNANCINRLSLKSVGEADITKVGQEILLTSGSEWWIMAEYRSGEQVLVPHCRFARRRNAELALSRARELLSSSTGMPASDSSRRMQAADFPAREQPEQRDVVSHQGFAQK